MTIEARRLAAARPAAHWPRRPPCGSGEEESPRPSGRTRTATSSTSCSRPRPTPSTSTTTTPSRAPASTAISTWCARGARPPSRRRASLDTGEALPVETADGDDAAARRGFTGGDGGRGAGRCRTWWSSAFPPVPPGGSVRLRIAETYTDPKSYRLEGDELVFDRTFGRPRNAVVLPAGWSLTASSIPAMVSETADGRIRLDFVNPRPDEIAVLIRARRRPEAPGLAEMTPSRLAAGAADPPASPPIARRPLPAALREGGKPSSPFSASHRKEGTPSSRFPTARQEEGTRHSLSAMERR